MKEEVSVVARETAHGFSAPAVRTFPLLSWVFGVVGLASRGDWNVWEQSFGGVYDATVDALTFVVELATFH